MKNKHPDRPEKRTPKRYSDAQLRDFELAGGAEGGMPAGRAGGPGEQTADKSPSPGGARDE